MGRSRERRAKVKFARGMDIASDNDFEGEK